MIDTIRVFSLYFWPAGKEGLCCALCAHGARMHVSRGKSLSGVPVNRLLFTAE